MSTSWCCAVSLGSDYGAWCRVTVCRLSCTASLILSINELRSTLLPRTPSINHNLSSVLCSPHTPSPFPPLPPPPLQTKLSLLHLSLTSQRLIQSHPFISSWLTSPKILRTTLVSQFAVVLCVVLCPAPVPFPDGFTCISIFSSHAPFFFPLLLSFHGTVSILSGFSPWNPHFNSASTPRLSKPSHIGK